jgi:hypothetical protein
MILALHWDAFFQQYRRWIRPVVLETVRKILACRTPVLGCHVYFCNRCQAVRVVPHSCKSRSCPTCGKHATDVWADGVLNDLLDVPYHHLVLSLPWQLRPTFLLNRRICFNLLFQAAQRSISQWAADVMGMRMGIVCVLHTFGSDLRFHPHIHLLVTGGGLSLDGTKWIATKPGFLMYHGGLKKRWRYWVVKLLRKAHYEKKLRFPSSASYLKVFPCFNALLGKLYQVTWHAHIGAALVDPRLTVRYIGRYTKRAVLAEYRITSYDGKWIRFSFKDYAQGGRISYKRLPVHTFLERFIRHIPDRHFPMVRHAGLFAPRWKARYLQQARRALGQKEPKAQEEAPPPLPSLLPHRRRQIARTGEDPLLCPRCERPMECVGTLFGPHRLIRMVFEEAGRPLTPWEADLLDLTPG